MITASDTLASVLQRSFTYRVRVQSWLGDTLLSDDVPVSAGREEVDRSLRIPERVTLTVPRRKNGIDWTPIADDHPLAANGQRLHVELGVDIGGGQTEWLPRGWFVIQDSDTDDDSVTVNAVGLLTLVDEARLVSPFQPSGTLASTLRGLIEPALTVVVDAALTDRAVPANINYDEDRLQAALDLIDAWPADAYVTEDGYLSVIPADQSLTPVLTLTDGTGGTVITATGSSTRDGGYNAVVARGTASDGTQVQGVAYLATGPKTYGGQFNPLPVPFFYSSPLLTTVAQCNAAARTVLARLARTSSQAFTVTMVPDPRVQAGDVVSITADPYTGLLCSVEALSLPYTAAEGAMTLTVRRVT
jgi:hypothetical protein